MHELLVKSIEAHGGLERWRRIREVSATARIGGVVLAERGQEAFLRLPTRVSVDTRAPGVTFQPFLTPGQRGVYAPGRTSVEGLDGEILQALDDPRGSFRSLAKGAPWGDTQLAYFVGYAMWMYFTFPFSLLSEGVHVEEAAPWVEAGETWRALKLTFPEGFASHSRQQRLYFDADGLIRRNDYQVEVAGSPWVAHYVSHYQVVDGLAFAARRRIYVRGDDMGPLTGRLVISADFEDIRVTPTAAPAGAP